MSESIGQRPHRCSGGRPRPEWRRRRQFRRRPGGNACNGLRALSPSPAPATVSGARRPAARRSGQLAEASRRRHPRWRPPGSRWAFVGIALRVGRRRRDPQIKSPATPASATKGTPAPTAGATGTEPAAARDFATRRATPTSCASAHRLCAAADPGGEQPDVEGTLRAAHYLNALLDNAAATTELLRKVRPVMGDFSTTPTTTRPRQRELRARAAAAVLGDPHLELNPTARSGGGSPASTTTRCNYAFALTGWSVGGATPHGCWPSGANCQFYGRRHGGGGEPTDAERPPCSA